MQQEIKFKENTLIKTAAPNLKAVEKLQMARDKFQESIDGNTESFTVIPFVTVRVFTLIEILLSGVGPASLLFSDTKVIFVLKCLSLLSF